MRSCLLSASESEYWNKVNYMMDGMKRFGVRLFRRTLVNGSKMEYEMKKTERAALYLPADIG